MAELSTFSSSSAPIATPAQPTEPVTTEIQNDNVIPNEQINNNQEQPVENQSQEQVNTNEDNNSSSDFSISLGEELEAQSSQQQAATPAPSFNWKEELKKIDKGEILKELGVNDFAIEIDKHILGGGQPIDYLQARAIDYNKFSDEALVKDSLRKEYPNLTPSQVDLMFNRKYSIPEDASDEDKEFLTAQLQADGYKIRQTKIAEQQRFKIADAPIPQKDEAYEQWKQNKDREAQEIETARNYFNSHPATKSLNESKRVTISLGEGVAPFNFVIDKPELINRVLTDDGTAWTKLTNTPQGEPDVAKQQLLTLVAANPQKVFQDIFNYGMQMGERKRVTEGQNAQRQPGKIAAMTGNEKATYRTGTYGKTT